MDWFAPVVAFILGGLFTAGVEELRSRAADKRAHARQTEQWQREDSNRRRVRAEEAAERILDGVEAAANMCRDTVRNGHPHSFPSQEDLRGTYTRLRREAIRVPDPAIQSAAEQAADTFYYYDRNDESLKTWQLASTIETEMRAAVGAYLRGDEIPTTPSLAAAFAQVQEYQEWIASVIDDDQ